MAKATKEIDDLVSEIIMYMNSHNKAGWNSNNSLFTLIIFSDPCVVMNTATLISIYFWDVKDIVLTLKRSETFETFIGIVKSYQEQIFFFKKIFFSNFFFKIS